MNFSLDTLVTLIQTALGNLVGDAWTAMQGWMTQIQTALGANAWIIGIVLGLIAAKMVGNLLKMVLIVVLGVYALSKLGLIPAPF